MKEHKGMRPQDIVILLKIVALNDKDWFLKDLASQLSISNSEISESLNRSQIAGLLHKDKREVAKDRLLEFLVYGLRYAFPVQPGRITRGLYTAHSAPFLEEEFVTEIRYVWPFSEGSDKGAEIVPLYSTVPQACKRDERLYRLLALADAVRISNPEQKGELVKKLAQALYNAI